MRAPTLAIAAALALGTPALTTAALAQVLPETSRAAGTAEGINRDLGAQGQFRDYQQQNQFQNNQLRSEIQRDQNAARPIGPRGRVCGGGAC